MNGITIYEFDALMTAGSDAEGVHRIPDKVYVWLEDQETATIPQTFNPDFWDMSLGVAFRFGGSHHEDKGYDDN